MATRKENIFNKENSTMMMPMDSTSSLIGKASRNDLNNLDIWLNIYMYFRKRVINIIEFFLISMATRYTIAYYFVINFLINFPFIVCNLYFAFNEIRNCSKMGILESNLGISLASWLKIFGFNQLLYILSIMIAALLRLCTG